MPVFQFIQAILPSLLELGQTLYELFKGDVELSKQNIQSRTAEVAALRAQIDAQLKAKHGG